MKNLLLIVLVLLMGMVTMHAQITTSNIRGAVVEDENNPLLGANIVAIHTPTGTTYGATTNEDGEV